MQLKASYGPSPPCMAVSIDNTRSTTPLISANPKNIFSMENIFSIATLYGYFHWKYRAQLLWYQQIQKMYFQWKRLCWGSSGRMCVCGRGVCVCVCTYAHCAVQNESWHTSELVMSYVVMRNVTHIIKFPPPIFTMSHGTQVNSSCRV